MVRKKTKWREQMGSCAICGKKMENALLSRHMELQHGEKTTKYVKQNTIGREVYQIIFVKKGFFNNCCFFCERRIAAIYGRRSIGAFTKSANQLNLDLQVMTLFQGKLFNM